ncbi:MAG TPA: hypothetical protein VGM05_29490 [Planctomycetaceae bacterium]|jgi:hypothetical protein
MKSIKPAYHLRPRPSQPQPVQQISFPKLINIFGHDPLLTPQRLPFGEVAHPFADVKITFESGAVVDVKQ